MLDCGTESPSFESGHGQPDTGKLCQLSSKWISFTNQEEGIKQQRDRDGLHLSYVVPKIKLSSNLAASTTTWLYFC